MDLPPYGNQLIPRKRNNIMGEAKRRGTQQERISAAVTVAQVKEKERKEKESQRKPKVSKGSLLLASLIGMSSTSIGGF